MAYSALKKTPPKGFILNIFAAVILCGVGIIVYSNTFTSPFHFDDKVFIAENPAIKELTNLGMIWNYWASRFITFLTFAINYKINGLDVFGYHLVNLIIHLGSSIGVFWLTTLILSTPNTKDDSIARHSLPISLFTALIFLSHPLQTESVTYILQRATCLSGFFYILSICLYLKSRLLQGEAKSWAGLYTTSLLFALLSMFTKEQTITLPFTILICEILFFRKARYRYAASFFILLPIIPILLILTKSAISGDMGTLITPQTYSEPYYFLAQLRAMLTYIRLSFIPINQNIDYDYPPIKTLFDPSSLASLFVLLIMLIVAFNMAKRHKLISFSIFWFFLTILPESSLIHIKRDFISERWLYLPLVGYSFFLVNITYQLLGKKSLKSMLILLLIVVTCYSALTYSRNYVWRDEFTLWNDAIRKSPNKARPYCIRGQTYLLCGDIDNAISDFTKAITIDSRNDIAYTNRGLAYFYKGDLDRAISDYSKAIEIYPNNSEAYSNRAVVYENRNEFDHAISDCTKAIEINPNFAGAYNNRGLAYLCEDSYDRAISDLTRAIELNPNLVLAYYNRGNAYGHKGDYGQAISDLTKVVELNPGFALAYKNRAVFFYSRQEYAKSWENVHKAEELGAKINPRFLEKLKKASGKN